MNPNHVNMSAPEIADVVLAHYAGEKLEVRESPSGPWMTSFETFSSLLRSIASGDVYRVRPEPQDIWLLREHGDHRVLIGEVFTIHPPPEGYAISRNATIVHFREVTDQPWPAGHGPPEYDAMQPLLTPRRTP